MGVVLGLAVAPSGGMAGGAAGFALELSSSAGRAALGSLSILGSWDEAGDLAASGSVVGARLKKNPKPKSPSSANPASATNRSFFWLFASEGCALGGGRALCPLTGASVCSGGASSWPGVGLLLMVAAVTFSQAGSREEGRGLPCGTRLASRASAASRMVAKRSSWRLDKARWIQLSK